MESGPKHPVRKDGYPVDPEMRKLEQKLEDLGEFYIGSTPEKRINIVREYHETMKRLLELGWEGPLHIEGYLPKNKMPPEYLEKYAYPNIFSPTEGYIDPEKLVVWREHNLAARARRRSFWQRLQDFFS
jgi:hypothetical protein